MLSYISSSSSSRQLTAAAAAKSLQSCLTVCDPIDGSPPGSPFPGILEARTRVGCHFLLQCMKVKSDSEVAQSCPTLSNPMDCSLPGSSVHGIFQARVLEWGAIAFSETLLKTALMIRWYLVFFNWGKKATSRIDQKVWVFHNILWKNANFLANPIIKIFKYTYSVQDTILYTLNISTLLNLTRTL